MSHTQAIISDNNSTNPYVRSKFLAYLELLSTLRCRVPPYEQVNLWKMKTNVEDLAWACTTENKRSKLEYYLDTPISSERGWEFAWIVKLQSKYYGKFLSLVLFPSEWTSPLSQSELRHWLTLFLFF